MWGRKGGEQEKGGGKEGNPTLMGGLGSKVGVCGDRRGGGQRWKGEQKEGGGEGRESNPDGGLGSKVGVCGDRRGGGA